MRSLTRRNEIFVLAGRQDQRVLGPYLSVLKLDGSWRLSFVRLVLRLPMSATPISIVLLIEVGYGNYSLVGLMTALNVIVTALCTSIIARYADRLGQHKVMGPFLAIEVTVNVAFLFATIMHASPVLVALITVITDATWGAPGAFVRTRWTNVLKDQPKGLTAAFTFESAIGEFVYILGLILSTVLGALFYPGVGLILICLFLGIGGLWFFPQSVSESTPRPKTGGERRQSVLHNSAMVVVVLTYIAMGFMFGANDVAVIAFAATLGVSSMPGVLLAFFSIGSLFAGPWYGSCRWVRPLWNLFAFGAVLPAIGTLTYLLARLIPTMTLAMTLTRITYTPTMTNVDTVIVGIAAPERLTGGLAWAGTSPNIGLSLGLTIVGPVIDAGGARSDYFVMMGAAWVMVAIMVLGLPSLCRATTPLRPRIEE